MADPNESAEGEDDEETLSADPCGSPMRIIKNDLSPQACVDNCQPSTSRASDFFGLNLQQTKETFYKDMPSSSKNFNLELDTKNKCLKGETSQCISNLDSLNLQSSSKSKKKSDVLNNEIRRYSDSSAQKNNASGSSPLTRTFDLHYIATVSVRTSL